MKKRKTSSKINYPHTTFPTQVSVSFLEGQCCMHLVCKNPFPRYPFNKFNVKKLKRSRETVGQKEGERERETIGVTQEEEWHEYSGKFQTYVSEGKEIKLFF